MKAGQLPLSVGWSWFLQQYRRWGMWQGDADQAVVAAITDCCMTGGQGLRLAIACRQTVTAC
jgi:hypothetical protein